jgi:phytoene desaturase
LKSKKVSNLFYTGQLTVPGPGVPPCLISGEVVAKEIEKNFK